MEPVRKRRHSRQHGLLHQPLPARDHYVRRPNRSPDAINDAYNAREDTTLTRPAPGVLANDADADGDSLSASFVEVVDGPAKGAVTLRANGSFDYKPKLNRSGADFFVYRASDGRGGTDTATVEITIAAVNDAPKVISVSPAPASSTRYCTPLIRARAMDAETNLTEARIKLFVDGNGAISATRFLQLGYGRTQPHPEHEAH